MKGCRRIAQFLEPFATGRVFNGSSAVCRTGKGLRPYSSQDQVRAIRHPEGNAIFLCEIGDLSHSFLEVVLATATG